MCSSTPMLGGARHDQRNTGILYYPSMVWCWFLRPRKYFGALSRCKFLFGCCFRKECRQRCTPTTGLNKPITLPDVRTLAGVNNEPGKNTHEKGCVDARLQTLVKGHCVPLGFTTIKLGRHHVKPALTCGPTREHFSADHSMCGSALPCGTKCC